MSTQRFVESARTSLAQLVGAGAVSAGEHVVANLRSLAGRARALGLAELGQRFDDLVTQLRGRGALAYEPSLPLTDLVLAIFDRVEALASTLELWSVEERLSAKPEAS